MGVNQTGIAITIKAFLPIGKTLDEQFIALSIVKDAKDSGNYDMLLAAAQDVSIKTESKTRRVGEKAINAPVVEGPDYSGPVAIVEDDENFSWDAIPSSGFDVEKYRLTNPAGAQ